LAVSGDDVALVRRFYAAFSARDVEAVEACLDVGACQLIRVRDGRIAEVRGDYSDQCALDGFWGPG
jgi:ketosteroid isomerase-like protein